MIARSAFSGRVLGPPFFAPGLNQRQHPRWLPVLAVVILTSVCAAQSSSTGLQALLLANEAAAAIEAKDHTVAVAKLEEASALRPDMPRILESLAIAQAAADRPDDAVATLQRLAELGVGAVIEKTEEFAALRPRRDFQAVVKKLASNLHPKGAGEVAFTLRDVTGLIEGLAWREKTGDFFFADVHARAVWRRQKDGALKRFTPDGDELLGVFALVVDEARGALWVATSAVPEMRGYSPDQEGHAALAEIDLETGAVRQAIRLDSRSGEQHVLSDLALVEDGSILLTDSRSPSLWRYRAGAAGLERFVDSAEFQSLQGIAVMGGVALVSDQTNGLLVVDLARRAVRRLEPPENTTLVGLDGLAVASDGMLVAVQNGLRPNRILRIEVDPLAATIGGVHVLDSGHLAMTAPSSGCVATGGDFFFIGNPGWNRFLATDVRPTAPRQVPVFRSKLTGKK